MLRFTLRQVIWNPSDQDILNIELDSPIFIITHTTKSDYMVCRKFSSRKPFKRVLIRWKHHTLTIQLITSTTTQLGLSLALPWALEVLVIRIYFFAAWGHFHVGIPRAVRLVQCVGQVAPCENLDTNNLPFSSFRECDIVFMFWKVYGGWSVSKYEVPLRPPKFVISFFQKKRIEIEEGSCEVFLPSKSFFLH